MTARLGPCLCTAAAWARERQVAFSRSRRGSPVMKTLASRILADDFSPNFYLHLLVKDMGYAIAEGESRGVPMKTYSAASVNEAAATAERFL